LKTMSDQPWEILYQDNVSPYSSLLQEIRKSIISGQIQLKDSDKVLQYSDIILKSLPDLQRNAQTIQTEIDSFREVNAEVVYKVKGLEHQIMQHSEGLARSRLELEQEMRHLKDKTEELNAILNQAGEILAELTGRKYYLAYDD
nr:hypothetical protein [Thermoproteota archaeon]